MTHINHHFSWIFILFLVLYYDVKFHMNIELCYINLYDFLISFYNYYFFLWMSFMIECLRHNMLKSILSNCDKMIHGCIHCTIVLNIKRIIFSLFPESTILKEFSFRIQECCLRMEFLRL